MDHIYWSLGTKCRVNQITVIQDHSVHCLDCVECPVGQGSVPQCGSFLSKNVTVRCKKCEKGMSYSESHDHTSCKPCRICVDNEEVIKSCTITSDTQCGECKPGWANFFDKFFLPHSFDQEIQRMKQQFYTSQFSRIIVNTNILYFMFYTSTDFTGQLKHR